MHLCVLWGPCKAGIRSFDIGGCMCTLCSYAGAMARDATQQALGLVILSTLLLSAVAQVNCPSRATRPVGPGRL